MDHTTDWELLATLLLEAAGDRVTALGHPIWVQVLYRPEGDVGGIGGRFDLALSDGEDPFMGQVVAPECLAVGMIGSGRLRPEPGPEPGPPGPPAGLGADSVEAVRMVCLVTREGRVTWRLARADGSRSKLLATDSNLPPSEGRLLDCLRRCLGLPTSPPPASPASLQTIVWLVAALERARGSGRPLTWSELSRLHPVARLLASELEAPASQISGITDALTRKGAAAYSWEDIRRQASRQEGFLDDLIHPQLAGWMDDGMFARWVLADLPSVDELFAALRPRLTPSAARRMAHAVHTVHTAHTAEAAVDR